MISRGGTPNSNLEGGENLRSSVGERVLQLGKESSSLNGLLGMDGSEESSSASALLALAKVVGEEVDELDEE